MKIEKQAFFGLWPKKLKANKTQELKNSRKKLKFKPKKANFRQNPSKDLLFKSSIKECILVNSVN